jgi:hypothetical protein
MISCCILPILRQELKQNSLYRILQKNLSGFVRQYKPESMNHPGNTAEDSKDNINPKMCAYSNLQKGGHRWEKNCQDNFYYKHKKALSIIVYSFYLSNGILTPPLGVIAVSLCCCSAGACCPIPCLLQISPSDILEMSPCTMTA